MMTVAEFAHPQEKGEGRDMGFTKNELLTRLKELQIDFYQYEHAVVLTVEAQDKKSRFYIVSALQDTKVDLKVLSQMLGLGKGGIRMASEEALGEILQANPPVGKDHPPDLAALVPSDSVSLSDPLENATPLHVPATNPISDKKFTAATVKATKPPGVAQDCKDNGASKSKDKPANAAHQRGAVSDVGQFVEEILEKASALLLSEITDNTIRQHGEHLGTIVSDCIVKRLGPDLKSLATMFKEHNIYARVLCWCSPSTQAAVNFFTLMRHWWELEPPPVG